MSVFVQDLQENIKKIAKLLKYGLFCSAQHYKWLEIVE